MGVCPYFSGQYCRARGGLDSVDSSRKEKYCMSKQDCTKCELFKNAVKKQNG